MKWIVDILERGENVTTSFVGNSMVPLVKSRQEVNLCPINWTECKGGDIVFCKVKGKYYLHLVKRVNPNRGCLIGNNRGGINGWTKKVYGILF